MKVYITGTTEINKSLIQEVCDELNAPKGLMSFGALDVISQKELSKIDKSFNNINMIDSLFFTDLFKICDDYRHENNIKDDEFVILLTSIRNNANWFSATKNRNVFIDINDWDKFTGKNPKYGISYQVVENIFQSLIGIDYTNAPSHPNVHIENDGCINDFCQNKLKVVIKLRTADICLSCQKKAAELSVDKNIMNNIQEITENIRKNVRKLNTYNNVRLEKVTINKNGKIKIGNKKIEINELPSTLFIFFLNQEKPTSKTSLKKYFRKIYEIYGKVNGRGNKDTIENLINPNGKAFRQNKWRVNHAIGNSISESLLGYYIIDEVEGEKYFISLSKEYKEIDENMTL